MQELKTATDDEMKMTIQRKLKKVEGNIRELKVEVNKYERQVNECEGRLGLLKKEGEFRL